jgi:DNA-directed RNA polymerase subunit RPC12/RpoP
VYFTFGAKCEIIARANVQEVRKVKSSREERKARLMKAAEEMIDELLDWSETTAEPNLTQIEAVVGRLRKALGEQMASEAINAQEARQPVPGPRCAECGREMRYKGPKEMTIESWVGDLTIERGYYHCPDCKVGIFPPRPTT